MSQQISRKDVLDICLNNGITEMQLVTLLTEEPIAIIGIPKERITNLVIEAVVNSDGTMIKYILEKGVTVSKDNAIHAVQNNGLALKAINEANLFSGTDLHDVQVAACTQTYKALKFCKDQTNLNAEITAAFPV